MPVEHTSVKPRVEVRVRSHTPNGAHERQREVITRLRQLEETEKIESFTVEVWGTSAEISADDIQDSPANDVLERFAAFERWADQNGHSLEPAFRKRTSTSMATDKTWEEVVFPIICLAVYEDDDLQAVFPCSEADRVQTIEDCLSQLETGTTEDGSADQLNPHSLEVKQ